jgi:hypothetical protein
MNINLKLGKRTRVCSRERQLRKQAVCSEERMLRRPLLRKMPKMTTPLLLRDGSVAVTLDKEPGCCCRRRAGLPIAGS